MRGERVSKRVARGSLRDPGRVHRVSDRPLDRRLVQVMAPLLTGNGIVVSPRRRKHPLPRPIVRRPTDLAFKGAGSRHSPAPALYITPVARPPPRQMIRQWTLY